MVALSSSLLGGSLVTLSFRPIRMENLKVKGCCMKGKTYLSDLT